MLSMIALAVTATAPATVKSGVDYWRAGEYPAAVAAWLPFAAQGDADALFNMGQAYKLGRGVTKDANIARDYYRKAATRGHLPAQANLGIALFQAGDKAEAVRWLKTAADRGEPRAQYVYGIAVYNGDGTPKNLGQAYGYLLRAKASGLAQATTALGSIEPGLNADARTAGTAMAAAMANGSPPPAIRPSITATLARKFDEFKNPFAAAPKPVAPTLTPPPIVSARPATLPPANIAVVAKPVPVPVVVAARSTPAPAPVQIAAAAPAPQPATIDDTPPPPKPVVVAVAPPTATPSAAAKPKPKPAPIKVADAEPAKPSGWRVQLGAFSSKKLADEAWTSVKTKQASAIGKAKPIFETSGPVVKFQIGPYADRTAARDVCAKLAFAGRACFVTQG